jgi:hypothetical protein
MEDSQTGAGLLDHADALVTQDPARRAGRDIALQVGRCRRTACPATRRGQEEKQRAGRNH